MLMTTIGIVSAIIAAYCFVTAIVNAKRTFKPSYSDLLEKAMHLKNGYTLSYPIKRFIVIGVIMTILSLSCF